MSQDDPGRSGADDRAERDRSRGRPADGPPDDAQPGDVPPADDEVEAPQLANGEHPARELMDLLGRAHALAVLSTVARRERRPWRFTELQEELDASPDTLSARLDELEAAGLLERRSYDEVPPRVEYAATEKAAALTPVFRRLHAWAERHWPEAE